MKNKYNVLFSSVVSSLFQNHEGYRIPDFYFNWVSKIL